MNTKPSLEGYQNIKHSFRVWEENGIYTLFIPEYGIFTKNEDLNEGYKELASEKEKYFLKLNEAGISSQKLYDLSATSNSFVFQKSDARIKGFVKLALKSIIVIALILGIGSVSLVVAGNVLSKNMSRVFHKIERYQPLEKLVSYVESLPEEKINMYRTQAHRISIVLQPILTEFQTTLKNKPDDHFQKGSNASPLLN